VLVSMVQEAASSRTIVGRSEPGCEVQSRAVRPGRSGQIDGSRPIDPGRIGPRWRPVRRGLCSAHPDRSCAAALRAHTRLGPSDPDHGPVLWSPVHPLAPQ